MLSRLLAPCLLPVLLWLSPPSSARAWTEAHVREAQVTLTVGAHDRLEVALDLALEVRGGWLERLELPGLDDGMLLAEQEPAVAILESGERVPAQVSTRASVLVLKFARRDGLRRGLHHLRVRYAVEHAAYAHTEHKGSRLYWTLPGFEAGLERATIAVFGPRAISAVEAPEVAQDVVTRDEAAQRVLTFSRLHVPRASPWTVAIDVPSAQVRAARPLPTADGIEGQRGRGLWTSLWLSLTSLALIGALRLQATRALAAEGLGPRGLLRRHALSPLALAALSALSALSVAYLPPLSVVGWVVMFTLGVPQADVRRRPLALGSFRAFTSAELRAARRKRLREWLGVPWADVSTLLGALGALSLLWGIGVWQGLARFGREPWSLLALCAVFGFLATARSLRARSFAEQLAALVRAAKRARTVGCAFSLVAYESSGRLSQPRLRIMPSARFPGLLRLEVLVDTRRSARPLVLSAWVEADSSAERWLSLHWPEAAREAGAGGRRIALLSPMEDVGRAVEALLEHMSVEAQRLLFQGAGRARAA